MAAIDAIIKQIDDIVWGVPLIVLILACGIMLTIRLRFVQIRKLGKSFKYMLHDDDSGHGDVSSFAALCTALSATVGTGNIVGVATAVSTGGAGALLWMEVAALFGMATKYAEGLLAIKYRTKDQNGNILGGPFYYIENGMGKKWKWLAKIFAFFGVFVGLMGIGTFTQINGITSAVKNYFDPESLNTVSIFGSEYSISVVIAGIIITVLAALVLIGGLKSISSVAQVVVPAMIITYVGCCLTVLLTHIPEIPAAVVEIVESAFGLRPIAGGIAGISIVILSAQRGIARGIFSNEAGLGSAPIAASAAKTKEPVRQGLVSMIGTFIDTIIVCTMTGLVIVIEGSHTKGLQGVDITIDAFTSGLPLPPRVSAFIVMVCLAVFAFTTILGWNYYSERCLSYLIKPHKYVTISYRWIYIAAVFIGPYLTVEAVWNIADIFNGLMALPNIVALVALSGVVQRETKDYLQRTGD
ncbi:MAG: alanine:cation symporter family protein [Ruminiclostridium sp.]|nr:alanine:cation symporter family protein [Ruminiclostridium sp.]